MNKIKLFSIYLLTIFVLLSGNLSAETFDLEIYKPTQSEQNIINMLSSETLPNSFFIVNKDLSMDLKLIEGENGKWVTKNSRTLYLKKDSLIYIQIKNGEKKDEAVLFIASSNNGEMSKTEFPVNLKLGETILSSFLDKAINLTQEDIVIADFQTSNNKDMISYTLNEILNRAPQKAVNETLVAVSLSQEQ